MVLWIHIEVTDFSVFLIFKFKPYNNANIPNFLYNGETRLFSVNRIQKERQNKYIGRK